LWNFIRNSLYPEIIFYRDFLSKFPEKIFLDPIDENPIEIKYRSIIEDVLKSISPSYTVETSLLDRLNSPSEGNKQALDAVENEMSAKITEVIFNAWSKIQKVSRKEIIVKSEKDGGRNTIRLKVKEGRSSYFLAERSLGFRWFFAFLLYTEFRKERIKSSGEILFLLDEPASNLHQSAQVSLMGTLEMITSRSRLVYTTHSHHLINPKWLDAAYVVKNKGLNPDDDYDFNSNQTEIEAYKYKQFVSNYPSQASYFQPILDVLDYKPGLLENVPNIVITEGKFDYFIFKYFSEVVFSSKKISDIFSFYPGQGASKLDLPISLYESWGRNYMVLLDADKEGALQKKRYIKDISTLEHIFTLEDVDPKNKGFTTESLFSEEEKIAMTKEFNPKLSTYDKNSFHTGLQTLYAEKKIPSYLSVETQEKMEKILNFCKNKLSQLTGVPNS